MRLLCFLRRHMLNILQFKARQHMGMHAPAQPRPPSLMRSNQYCILCILRQRPEASQQNPIGMPAAAPRRAAQHPKTVPPCLSRTTVTCRLLLILTVEFLPF